MTHAQVRSHNAEGDQQARPNAPRGWQQYTNPTSFVSLYRRFPVTISLLAPYVLLVLPPAFVFENPRVWFLIGVALIALAGAFIAEVIRPKAKDSAPATSNAREYGRALLYVAVFAIVASSITSMLASYAGRGSVAVQIGAAEVSTGLVDSLDSLIGGWVYVGIGLLLAAHVGGMCSTRFFFLILSVPVVAGIVNAYFTQITAPLLMLVTFLAMVTLLFGIIKVKVVLIGAFAVLLVWPVIFDIRNDLRAQEGVQVTAGVEAFDRLRFDLQFARAQDIEVPLDIEIPTHLVHPTPLDILRFGVIPRILDPARPVVSTGQVINVALGGNVTSAYTFGPVTTAYALEGPLYVFVYYFLLAVYVNLIWRGGARITPFRVMLLALVMSGPLGWFSTFPDTIIGMLQDLVSSLPLVLVLFLRRAARGRRSADSEKVRIR